MLNAAFTLTVTGFLFGWAFSSTPSTQKELGYLGSEKCLSCHARLHPEIAKNWQSSPHALTSRPHTLREYTGRDSKQTIPVENEEILLFIGGEGTGSAWVRTDLQVFLREGVQLAVTFPPHDQIGIEGATVNAAQSCLGCHTTGYSVSDGKYIEPGVGCEACHGPGKEHVDSGGSKATIVSPSKLPADRNRMVCGQCHSLGTDPSGKHPFPVFNVKFPFQPGSDLTVAFVDSQPVTTLHGGEYSTFVNSPEPYSSQLCTDCHDPHGNSGVPSLLRDPTSNLCKRCHSNPLAGIDQVDEERHWGAHRHNCWDCHDYTHLH